MRLTAKSEYGLLAMIDLACAYGGGPTSARDISERRGIPARFLEQLFVTLRRSGMVTAVRGARGGFVLAKAPDEVSVLDVVEALEGPLSTGVCDAEREVACARSSMCAASGVWSQATEALRSVFGTTTLADLASRQTSLDEADLSA